MVKNKYEQLYNPPVIEYYGGKTLRYLIPALGMRLDKLLIVVREVKLSAIDILRYLGLKGIYYAWEECPDKWENEVYVVFNPNRNVIYTSFPLFYKYLNTIPNFTKLYHVNNNLMVVVMKIDDKWSHLKEIVGKSEYSKMGKTYANNYFNNDGVLKKEFHIICKTDEYRKKLETKLNLSEDFLLDMELDSLFDIHKETFSLTKLGIEFKKDL